jgi:hypothetical protein
MSLSPLDTGFADAYTTSPNVNLVLVAKTFWSRILKAHVRKRRRHRKFAASGKTLVTGVNTRLAIPPKCIVVGHLCPVEVSIEPTNTGGSSCIVDVHCPNEVSVLLWTSMGATVVHTNAQVRSTCRIAAVEFCEKMVSHATTCAGTDKAALWRASNFTQHRPGITVWVASLPLSRYAILQYDAEVGWVCPTCGGNWPVVQGLLDHLQFKVATIDQLVAGRPTPGVPPRFTRAVHQQPRPYISNLVTPAVLRGRLKCVGRPIVKAPIPRLTIGPRW